METVTQITVILPNRPGALADLLGVLEEQAINVVAMCLVDTAEHGLARLVVDDPPRLRQALEACGIPFGESRAASVALPNVPGTLGKVARKLAKAKVNIDYAYASASDAASAQVILGVSDFAKAAAALEPPP